MIERQPGARPESDVPAFSIAEIIALYERFGAQHYDEELSQIAHALQTAALAVRAGAADPLVAAALLHDVGHLLELARCSIRWRSRREREPGHRGRRTHVGELIDHAGPRPAVAH